MHPGRWPRSSTRPAKKKFKPVHPWYKPVHVAPRHAQSKKHMSQRKDEVPVAVIPCDKPDAFETGLQRRERLAQVEHLEAQTVAQQLENLKVAVVLLQEVGMDDGAKAMLKAQILALASQRT